MKKQELIEMLKKENKNKKALLSYYKKREDEKKINKLSFEIETQSNLICMLERKMKESKAG